MIFSVGLLITLQYNFLSGIGFKLLSFFSKFYLLGNIVILLYVIILVFLATTVAEAVDIIDVTGFLYWKPRYIQICPKGPDKGQPKTARPKVPARYDNPACSAQDS